MTFFPSAHAKDLLRAFSLCSWHLCVIVTLLANTEMGAYGQLQIW